MVRIEEAPPPFHSAPTVGAASSGCTMIRPYQPADCDPVVEFAIRAWAPVFASIKQALDPDFYAISYPGGWEKNQRAAVAASLENEHAWIWDEGGAPAGFVTVKLDEESKLGEIYMIAVDPDHQQKGIAKALTDFAVEQMRDAGMTLAMVETGLDDGHAPARRTYEKAGFVVWPAARFFKPLD